MRSILKYILKLLSKAILAKYRPFVIAITGSVGKTSTKESIYKMLSNYRPGQVHATEKNLNTEIGVPIAIIGGIDAHSNIFKWLYNIYRGLFLIVFPCKYPTILVLELAADKPGDIKYLARLVCPNVAVLTALGQMPVHLESYPSYRQYINEKAEILKALRKGGVAILNYDDKEVRGLAKRIDCKILFYGMEKGANVRAVEIMQKLPKSSRDIGSEAIAFKIEYAGSLVPFTVKGSLGKGVLASTLAAVCVGIALGKNLIEITSILNKQVVMPGRMCFIEGVKNTIIIDDTYNSSPLALKEALTILSEFKENRKIVVLGDMKELGINNEKAHREVGAWVSSFAQTAFLVGNAMVFAKEELEKAGWQLGENLFCFDDSLQAAKALQDYLQEGDVALVKGSQSMRMERIIEEVMARPERAVDLLVRQERHWKNTRD